MSLKIALTYLAVGLGWIFLSDSLVDYLSGETAIATTLQSAKGFLFIIATAIVLYLVISSYARRILRSEHELIAREESYHVLLEQASDGIFIFDQDGRLTAANARACEMLAYSRTDILSLDMAALLVPESASPHPLALQSLHRGEALLAECYIRCQDGSTLPVEISAKMLEDGRIQAIGRDITRRKRAQEELDRRTRDLDERVHQTNCLYAITRLLRPKAAPVEEILQKLVEQIAMAYRYPDVARVRLVLDERTYESTHFDEPDYSLKSDLVARGKRCGWLEVAYLKGMTPPSAQCFTESERELLDVIAAHVTEFLEYTQTQEDLRATKDRLQAVFDATPLAVIVLDREADVTTWNPAAERIFGWKADEIIGQSYRLVAGEDWDSFMAQYHEKLIKGFFQSESRRLRKDGTVLQVGISSAPLRNAEGQAVGVVGVLEDVTQQKEVERRFSAMVQRSMDIIGIVDARGIIRYVSPSVENVLGYKPEEIIGQPALSFLQGEDALEAIRSFRGVIDNPLVSATTVTYRVRHANGSWVTLESVVSNEASDILGGLVVNSRDLTERKRVEEQFRRAQKMEAIGRLSGGIAHDFNNLLMAIGGYAEMLLLTAPKDSSQQEDILQIISVVDRGAALVRQLLTFSRRKEPTFEALDLNAAVAALIRLLERTLGCDIKLTSSFSENLPAIRADMSQMEQIIINLAVNARDAMPKGGNLNIQTNVILLDLSYPAIQGDRPPGQYVKLSVSDTGMGMTEEVRSRVFEPFFTTKQEGKGTGLGLATVYSIVEDHRGFIQVYSEPGHGTSFHIYLPVPHEKSETANIFEEVHAKPTCVLTGNETVLLLEDDPLLRKMTRDALEAFGYRVLAAGGLEEADTVLRENENSVALMLSDVVLPGTSGPEAYERLKEIAPSLKVLFMSGYSRGIAESHGLSPDATLLEKPFSLTRLTRAVREALSGEFGTDGHPSSETASKSAN